MLPADAPWREELHNEVHARPSARIRLPALVVFVAVLNEGIGREQELAHLRRLPGQAGLQIEDLRNNFLRLRFDQHTLKWERHTEFTRYSLVQTLPEAAGLGAAVPDLLRGLAVFGLGGRQALLGHFQPTADQCLVETEQWLVFLDRLVGLDVEGVDHTIEW